jgi:hypothetical protein
VSALNEDAVILIMSRVQRVRDDDLVVGGLGGVPEAMAATASKTRCHISF